MRTEVKPVALTAMSTASALAIVAGATPATADGVYAGMSYNIFNGESPLYEYGGDEDYFANTGTMGAFIGYQYNVTDTYFVGAEIAYNGALDAANEDTSYDYSYDVHYTLDAKLRVGATLAGQFEVYGFGGYSMGKANAYNGKYGGYAFDGFNVGVGANYNVTDSIKIGAEYVYRSLQNDYYPGESYNNNTIALRTSFNF